jgi:hypothetical protein
MKLKRAAISIILATVMLVSLFAVVSSAASVSGQTSGATVVGQTMAGTGPAVTSSPLAAPAGYGEINLFAVDTSGTLWHTPINGSNNAWDSLGGVCTSSPAAVCPWNSSYFTIDVFVRGSDGALWWEYYQNGWSNWHSLGGQVAVGTGPAVASWSAGRLDVFVEGTNGALYHKWSTNSGTSWSNWENLGGKLTSSPAATFDANVPYQATNSIYVFVRGTDGAVWQKNWNGTVSAWSSWTSLGGQVAPNTGPAVSQALFLFLQGTDHQLWFKSPSEGLGLSPNPWSNNLGGKPSEALSNASPAAVMLPSMHTMVCVSGTSGDVWYCGQNSAPLSYGPWVQWLSAGSPS